MASVSLCMIVRDEEDVLRRCLASAAEAVDEIIIVDTGSADRTKEIAAEFTGKIYDFVWRDDFAAARNFAFSKGSGDYLMWLDADDVLPAPDAEKLLAFKAELDSCPCDVIMMPYDTAFDENGVPVFSYYRERLLRNVPPARWEGRVHEVVPPFGVIRHMEIPIQHRKTKQGFSDRNLRIYETMLAEGAVLGPREEFYYARELYSHKRYAESAAMFRQFLKNPKGWLENKLEACRQLADCLSALGKEAEALKSLLNGLSYAVPGGELCCALGWHFFVREDWKQAAFWYENALRAEKRTESGAFMQEECYGYLPCIQLCVCYDRLGEREKAEMYNDMAGLFKPNDEAVEKNKLYFQKNGRPA